MNDDAPPSERLAELKAEHRQLDELIEAMRADGTSDQLEIARLKKRKLRLRDEIALLADQVIPDIIA